MLKLLRTLHKVWAMLLLSNGMLSLWLGYHCHFGSWLILLGLLLILPHTLVANSKTLRTLLHTWETSWANVNVLGGSQIPGAILCRNYCCPLIFCLVFTVLFKYLAWLFDSAHKFLLLIGTLLGCTMLISLQIYLSSLFFELEFGFSALKPILGTLISLRIESSSWLN